MLVGADPQQALPLGDDTPCRGPRRPDDSRGRTPGQPDLRRQRGAVRVGGDRRNGGALASCLGRPNQNSLFRPFSVHPETCQKKLSGSSGLISLMPRNLRGDLTPGACINAHDCAPPRRIATEPRPGRDPDWSASGRKVSIPTDLANLRLNFGGSTATPPLTTRNEIAFCIILQILRADAEGPSDRRHAGPLRSAERFAEGRIPSIHIGPRRSKIRDPRLQPPIVSAPSNNRRGEVASGTAQGARDSAVPCGLRIPGRRCALPQAGFVMALQASDEGPGRSIQAISSSGRRSPISHASRPSILA